MCPVKDDKSSPEACAPSASTSGLQPSASTAAAGRWSANQGRNTSRANDRVEDASTMPIAREGLPRMEMSQELPFSGPLAPCTGGAPRFSGDRCFLRAHMDNPDKPEGDMTVRVPILFCSVLNEFSAF